MTIGTTIPNKTAPKLDHADQAVRLLIRLLAVQTARELNDAQIAEGDSHHVQDTTEKD